MCSVLAVVSEFIDILRAIRDDASGLEVRLGPAGGILPPLGVTVFLQKQTILADDPCDMKRVALTAMGVLRAQATEAGACQSLPAVTIYEALYQQLYEAAISPDRGLFGAAIADLQDAGISNHDIKVEWVPAIARRLGEDWVNDVTPFGAVTIGCVRLQSIVRHLHSEDLSSKLTGAMRPQHCLVIVPEHQQHTLGAIVLTEHLRHAGAEVHLAIGSAAGSVTQLLKDKPFDAVMISAALGESVEALRALVRCARSARNRRLCSRQAEPGTQILIGGGLLDQRPDLLEITGADHVTSDPQKALALSTPDTYLRTAHARAGADDPGYDAADADAPGFDAASHDGSVLAILGNSGRVPSE